MMKDMEEIKQLINKLVDPDKCTKGDALEILEELETDIQFRIECIEQEIEAEREANEGKDEGTI